MRDYGVPIVSVTEKFGQYLVDNALSEFTDPWIEALVQMDQSEFLSIAFLLTLCLICCCFSGV